MKATTPAGAVVEIERVEIHGVLESSRFKHTRLLASFDARGIEAPATFTWETKCHVQIQFYRLVVNELAYADTPADLRSGPGDTFTLRIEEGPRIRVA